MDKNKKEKVKNNINSLKNNKKLKNINAILKFGILLIILIGIPVYLVCFHSDWIDALSDFEHVKAIFQNHKDMMVLLYCIAQCVQIVICIIPGQWLQIAAGYFFGIPFSLLLSIIGAIAGTVITYYLAKLLGTDAMHLFFGEKKIEEMIKRLNSKKAAVIIFLIYLIPGLPKDFCSYAAGLSEMKLKPFLVISTIGRTPGMLGSIIIGRQLATHSYTAAIIIAVIAIICFVLGIKYREKITHYLDSLYDKYIDEEGEKNEKVSANNK